MEDRMESGKQDNMNISTGAMGVSSEVFCIGSIRADA